MRGFTNKTVGGVDFWIKEAQKGEDDSGPAIVVISGIGIGLVAYMKMIDTLLETYPDRKFILSDLPEYSMRLTLEVNIVTPRDRASALAAIIGEGGAHVIAHSLGSVVISWLIRLAPEHIVRGCTFIDPVCFFLFNSSVAANFCYRTPRTPLDCLVSYFVGKELYVSNALHRHFRWDLNALGPHMLDGIPTAVILADHDHFVPSFAIERVLAANAKHVRVTTLKDHSHSQFCVVPSSTAKIVEEIKIVDKEMNLKVEGSAGGKKIVRVRSRSVKRRMN
jgi:pimeloyl-ACP methyl ester carboxylesterase